MLDDREGLDAAGVRQVRPAAEVDERAAAVDGGERAVGHLGGDGVRLEGVVGEEPQRVRLAERQPLEGELCLCDLLGLGLEQRRLLGRHDVGAHVGVVEEARARGRAVGELRAQQLLDAQPEHVRRRVPEGLAAVRLVKRDQLHLAVALEGAGEVPELEAGGGSVGSVGVLVHLVRRHHLAQTGQPPRVFELGDAHAAGELLADRLGDRERRVEPGGERDDAAVGHRDVDRLARQRRHRRRLLGRDLVENGRARRERRRVWRLLRVGRTELEADALRLGAGGGDRALIIRPRGRRGHRAGAVHRGQLLRAQHSCAQGGASSGARKCRHAAF